MTHDVLIQQVHTMVDQKMIPGASLALIEPDGLTMDIIDRENQSSTEDILEFAIITARGNVGPHQHGFLDPFFA